ncbi:MULTISPECIES: thioredoxin family protein [Halobacterium]|uniref:thioredoxin family protein n=1 Tax=Halobacterium TaxID=2239 RepID=UPI0019643A78|nr:MULTISPECIES: thioredoxin family protein [Halobacterium]MCF2166092.1 thioredoxin family protein [Halobacterium salinarum]MCF2166814.1 thioredoxin family protein [Halobacterium salinarum]MDL0129486.1 thioredoxin family protein [Halobacterium salinarum]MDL0143235.1 thioredoxin family protein [Halobacterium salinarum]QRY22846.1 thioredoxin family protein [Halobacterium sp. GSL-19]
MTVQHRRPDRVADGDDLDAAIAGADRVLVLFYTTGCSLCQAIEPVVGNVARDTGVPVVMVNPGDDIGLVDEWAIRSVPTLVLVEDGTEVGRLADGFQGGDAIEAFIADHA